MERASLGEELTDYLNDESSKGMIIESFDSYDWENNDIDMLELSEIFPGVIFKLHGEGENPEDIWDSYYKNGKSHTYMMEIPPLDLKDLE